LEGGQKYLKNRGSNAVEAALPACRQAGAGRPLTKGFPNSGAHRGAPLHSLSFLRKQESISFFKNHNWIPVFTGMTQSKFKGRLGGIFFLKDSKGISALFLVIAMLVMITIGYVFSYLIPTKQRSVVFPIQSTQAFFIAQAGVEFAVRYAKDNGWTTTTLLNSNLNGVTRTLGSGRFTLSYTSGTDTLTSVGEVPSGTSRRKIDVSSFTSFLYYFTYRKSIAVKSGQVSSGPHTDFPMLVSVTDSNLATVANNGHIASYDATNNDPRDLVFMGLDDNTCNVAGGGTNPCRLSHQIETYNSSTGQLIAWVKVPKMYYTSSSDRTVIYIYYGNSCMTASTQNASGVWNINYVGVWHLQENQSGTGTADLYRDSTSNSNHGDDYISATGKTGQIASGQQFDNSDDYALVGNSTSLGITGNITISAWIKRAASNDYSVILGKTNTSRWDYDVYMGISGAKDKIVFWSDSAPGSHWVASNGTITDTNWHYVVAARSGSTVSFYIDGSASGTPTLSNAFNNHSDPVRIGNDGAANSTFAGYLDEVRLSNSARNAGWVATEYNNQSAPGSFYTEGAEENN
jgi:hypothetical protein